MRRTARFCMFTQKTETAAEIEDNFALHIATVASGILKREIEIALVLPKAQEDRDAVRAPEAYPEARLAQAAWPARRPG
jgi:hypothetical protein